MPNITAAESGLLFSSDLELENTNNNNDDNDCTYRYYESELLDPLFDKPLDTHLRQSNPDFESDCSNVFRCGDGCCPLGYSLDCECEGLESSGNSCPKTMVNVSCRAVARPSDCGLGYQYQIIDIKTYPEIGLLFSPPGNEPCPLDLDSLCTKAEEPPECCPSWSRTSGTRSDSYSRHSLPSRPKLRRRLSDGSPSFSKSTEPGSSEQLTSSPGTRSSNTRGSNATPHGSNATSHGSNATSHGSNATSHGSNAISRGSNATLRSRTTTTTTSTSSSQPTRTQSRSSRSIRSKEFSSSLNCDTVPINNVEPTDDELNENENNVSFVKDNGSVGSLNAADIDLGIPEEENEEEEEDVLVNDGYSDVDDRDLSKDTVSSENIKSAVLDTIQSQLRFKNTQSGQFSKSSKYSDSTLPNNAGKSIPKYQPSEEGEIVLNKVDYHPMLSYPRLKTQPNKRTSSAIATAGSASTCDRHQAKMMKFLRSLYCQRELTDITIQVGCSCFNAHRVVLSCYSRYFASRLVKKSCCPLKNILRLENNITAKTFSAILDFMYTGECQIDRGNLAKMFTAADFLEINSLKVRCERLLCSGFKDGSASNKSLQLEKQWQQVARNFRVITKTDQFLSLSSDCIRRLLRRDDLSIDSEMDVAKAAVRWLSFDRENRKKYTRSVMSSIRFKDLWPEELVRLTNTHQSLLADDGIKEAIFEANWYHTCQQRENSCKFSSSLD